MKSISVGVRWVLEGRSSAAATLQTLITRLMVIVTSVLTGALTARLLGAEGRGEMTALMTWPQFLAYALTLGIPYALIFNLKKHLEKQSGFFSAALGLSILLGLVGSSIGIAFIPRWLSQYSPQVIQAAQWLMLTAPLILLTTFITSILEARGEFTIANRVNYSQTLLTLVCLGGLGLFQLLTPLTAALAYSLTWLPLTGWMLLRLVRIYQVRWQGIVRYSGELLSLGLRSYGINLIGTLSGQVGQALVVGLLAPKELGLYAVALSVSRMLGVFQGSIVTVLLPKISACPKEEILSVTGRATRLSAVLTGLTAIAAIIISPALLWFIYGAEFLEAVSILRILVIEAVIGSTTWVLAQAFMAMGRPGVVTIFQGIGLGLNVPLLMIFIPLYGLSGAGLAMLGATIVRLFFLLVAFPLILKVRPPSLLLNLDDLNFLRQRFSRR